MLAMVQACTRKADLPELYVRREGAPEASTSAMAMAVQGVSLDTFAARHTSEDNASFAEIVERSNKRRRMNQPWLFQDPNQVRSFILRHTQGLSI